MYTIINNFLVCVLIVSVLKTSYMDALTDGYGPYVLVIENFKICKGPKRLNVTKNVMDFVKGTSVLRMNITYLKPTKITMIRAEGTTDNGKKDSAFSYRTVKPCEDYLTGPFINTIAGNKNCVISQGNYNITMDFNKILQQFVPRYFYGIYRTKVVAVSEKGNVACFLMEIALYPRKAHTQKAAN